MKELTLGELQKLEIDILKDIHDFCVNNNIRYSLYGGSAIGAVRHSGFIPWDDDIDIVMPRGDYEMFCKNYSSEYELIARQSDKNTLLAFARVCDNRRTIYQSTCPWHKNKNGVWVDIFPADGFDSKDNELYNDCLALRHRSLQFRYALRDFELSEGIMFNIKLLVKKFFYSYYAAGKVIDRLIDKCKTYEFGKFDSWAVLACPYPKRIIHPIDSFKNVELVKFGDYSFFLLCGYDTMLTNVYGDYMQLPPLEKRVPPMKETDKFYWID